jgi:hypothetical protein
MSTAVWRARPVFITSTFRNMHAERDHQVKNLIQLLRIDAGLVLEVVMPELANRGTVSIPCRTMFESSFPPFIRQESICSQD